MTVETRVVHLSIDPALRAFFAYLDVEARAFLPEEYELFAAGYRAARDDDDEATP